MASNDNALLEYCTHVTPECPVSETIYTYAPNLGINAFFAAFFAIATILQVLFGIKWRVWTYMIAMVRGCTCETVGFVGRIILHRNPWNTPSFEIQIICLIIAPAFLAAAVYLSLKHLVLAFGEKYSLIKAEWYTWAFITGDFVALIMQGAGGAVTAASQSFALIQTGEDIAIAGICWQVASLVIFGILTLLYLRKVLQHRDHMAPEVLVIAQSTRFRCYCVGLILAYTMILVRCIYRIPELAGGWRNSIMVSEVSFVVLDNVMILIAVAALIIAHPG